jgi:hypothetical protein
MSSDPVWLERRAGQRFEVHLPVSIRFEDRTVPGFTQDVSTRGMFFYADVELPEGSTVELTFTMPSEITLAESMHVRCCARVLRSCAPGSGLRNGIAVHLDSYQYLTASEPALELTRVSDEGSSRENSAAIPR